MITTRAPSPRFKRPADQPRLQLTEDDDQILFHVFRHRIINSALIYALFPARSKQKLSRRLQALWQAGYLDRPVQQMERVHVGDGSAPLIYTLDRFGAERLRDRYGVDTSPGRWRQKNREIRGRSIQHALSTTRFMVEVEVAARQHGEVSLLHTDEVFARFKTEQSFQPGARLTLRSKVDWHGYRGEEGTAPDRLFALERPEGLQVFLLEIDQGTETIEPGEHRVRSRSFFRDTSLLRKFVVYANAFKARTHRQQYGVPSFRVLTVTTNRGRVEQMQATYQKHLSREPHGVNPGLFLFTDWQTWQEQAGKGCVVENGAGRPIALL
jgi:hypothetical protein